MGNHDNDQATRTIIQYGNTTQKATGVSTAENLFGGQMQNFQPVIKMNYKPQRQWNEEIKTKEEKNLKNREEAGTRHENTKTL